MSFDALLARWRALGLRDADALGAELIARYAEPQRVYHVQAHLAQVLELLAEWNADPRLSIAAFFHDVVYEPGRGDNEARSAALARERLPACGMAPSDMEFVADAVLATASHIAANVEFTPLLDADLAILGAASDAYDTYRAQIRAEYADVDDASFRAGRLAFVRAVLARDAIFQTGIGRARFETQARANLARERDALI